MPRLNLYLTALEDEQLTERAEAAGLTRGAYVKLELFPSGWQAERLTLGPVDVPGESIASLKIEVGIEDTPDLMAAAEENARAAAERQVAKRARPRPSERPAFQPLSKDEQVKK